MMYGKTQTAVHDISIYDAMKFLQKLNISIKQNNSILCVGLDNCNFEFNKKIINQTHDSVCAYKPQIAFYEASGIEGLKSLKKTVDYLKKNLPSLPVICDAKRGDIASTMEQYAASLFDYFGFDAATVNPYLGFDSVEPFLKRKDKGIIILCRTSNKSASDFQDLIVNGEPLYMIVAKKVVEWNKRYKNCLMVVGATWPEELKLIRKIAPDMFFLVPGIGTQGGDLERTLKYGLTKQNSGLIIHSSRSIIYDNNPKAKAEELRNAINRYRDEE